MSLSQFFSALVNGRPPCFQVLQIRCQRILLSRPSNPQDTASEAPRKRSGTPA